MAELVALSPVHIGSGEKLTSFDSVFRDDRLSVINVSAFLSENPERAEAFYAQASRRGFSLRDFLREEEVSAYSRYSITCPKEPGEVGEAVKNARGEVYLPGSSIKGALRTALACYLLSEADDDTWEKIEKGDRGSDIRGVRNVSDPKRVGREVEKVIFGCGYRKGERDIPRYGDAKFDLLKFITVRDSSPVPPGECLGVSVVKVYSISGGRVRERFNTFVESILPGRSFEFEIAVDTRFIARAEELETKLRWLGLRDKLERCFGITPGEDERASERKVLETVEKACRFFSGKVIERELSILPEEIYVHAACGSVVGEDFRNKGRMYCRKCSTGGLGGRDVLNVSDEVEGFYRSLKGKTLLRLGASTSWYSHTVGVMLSEELMEYVRRSFRLGRRYSRVFPKTRRFAFDANGRVYPLGWMEVRGL